MEDLEHERAGLRRLGLWCGWWALAGLTRT